MKFPASRQKEETLDQFPDLEEAQGHLSVDKHINLRLEMI
jgi:hypothetical protein